FNLPLGWIVCGMEIEAVVTDLLSVTVLAALRQLNPDTRTDIAPQGPSLTLTGILLITHSHLPLLLMDLAWRLKEGTKVHTSVTGLVYRVALILVNLTVLTIRHQPEQTCQHT